MDAFMRRFSINCHSSIRCGGEIVMWFDPFRVEGSPQDGDIIFVTHEHYDHFSPEDIRRVMRHDAVLVLPESCRRAALDAGFSAAHLAAVRPDETYQVKGVCFETVPAYNIGKKFHPQANQWVGYVVTVDGHRVYVAGDTDDTPEARAVRCDAAFLPAGGTYTMTPRKNLPGSIEPGRFLRGVTGWRWKNSWAASWQPWERRSAGYRFQTWR